MFLPLLKAGLVLDNQFNALKIVKTSNIFCRRFVKTEKRLAGAAMSLLLSVLLMMPVISCQHPRQNITQSNENNIRSNIRLKRILVPRWYAELPIAEGCRLAYGYGGIYLDADRQKEVLLKNGAENMAKNDKVLIKAGWAGTQTTAVGLAASYILENGWQDRASALEKNLKIVREYRMENDVIALCSFCPDASSLQGLMNRIDDRLVNINADEPPEWVRAPRSNPGFVYGVGIAPSRIKPAEAWEEAERQARASLAFNLTAHQDILEKTYSDNTISSFRNFSETKAEIALANVAIIRHGYSRTEQTFYALAQMPMPAGRINTDK
jgi:hypothetical protein